MRRWGWFLAGVLAALVLACGAPRWVHDAQTAYLRWDAERIPLVEGRVVASSAQFGLLWGNSNHCDTQVWVAVDSGSSPVDFVGALPDRELWDATDPARPAYVMGDGSLAGLDADRIVPGTDLALEAVDLEALATLARANPVAPGRRLYVLRTVRQSYDDADLLDVRCH